MGDIGLDVHRDFCEVALSEDGELRSAGRIETTPQALELFAVSLGSDDEVALELTGNAWEIARIIEPHVRQVLVVSPADTGIRQARAKTDRLDARALARLLAAGSLDGLWLPDERTRALRRRLARRARLVRARTRAKNEVHAAPIRRLIAKPKVSDLFGREGRRRLDALELPADERETVDSALRQVDFLEREIAEVEALIARQALDSPEARRLLTVPGVNVITAAHLPRRDRRHPAVSEPAQARRLAGARSEGAPVGPGAGEPRPDLEAGLGADTLRARRGCLVGRPPARPPPCLL
jgi:transposase